MKQFSLEEYLKNPSWKVVTRDSNSVRIICTDARNNNYPIIALVSLKGGTEVVCAYTKNGTRLGDKINVDDLFFAPEKHEGWINVYRNPDTGTTSFGAVLYDSRKEAEEVGKSDDYYYVSTAKIEWEE